MLVFGWTILALVFVDELVAVAAAMAWGVHVQGWPLAIVVGIAVIAVWWTFASPKAPLGGTLVRPVTKVLVFGAASAGLWATGRHGLAIALLVFSIVVNALAQLPSVRRLAAQT